MVVIADLVAKIRADTSDLTRGAQESKQALAGVEQQARATAAQIDQMARALATTHGGTVGQWAQSLQQSGVSAQAAAQALGNVGQQTTRVAAGADQMASALRSAARAAEDLGRINISSPMAAMLDARARAGEQQLNQLRQQQQRQYDDLTRQRTGGGGGQAAGGGPMDLSSGTLLRGAGALVGVGLGLSAIVGLAGQVHQAIVGIVTSQFDWEQSLVRVRALYGATATGMVATSQAQAAAPGLLGSQQEFLQANINASYLTRRYGLAPSAVTDLTSSAGRLSSTFAYDEQRRRDLQARTLQFAETGADVLRPEGIAADPLAIARQLGGVSAAQLEALTPQQLVQARALIARQQENQVALQGNAEQRGLVNLQRDREQALAQAQSRLQQGLEGNANQIPAAFQISRRGLPANPQAVAAADELQKLQQAASDAQQALDANAKAIGDHSAAIARDTADMAKLGVEIGSATWRLLGFTGNLEFAGSIARGDIAAQAQAAVAGRARSTTPAAYMSDIEIRTLARNQGEQEAYQNFVAAQAQAVPDSGIRQYLRGVGATGALSEADRRTAAREVGGQAQRAGALADRAAIEAQSQVSELNLRADERRLNVAEQLAGYQREILTIEGALAPLAIQQANLYDKIAVASRDNLTSRRALIQAEQTALAPRGALQDLEYGDQRVQLQAQARIARQLRGQDVSGLPSINELITQHVANQLDRPEVALRALDTGHAAELVQRQRTGEELGRAGPLTGLEAQGRAIQDQQIPLQQNQRAFEASAAAEQRTVDLLNLADTAARTLAGHQLNAASQLKLETEATVRQAEDLANKMDLGATAAERSTAALQAGRDAVNDTAVALASVRELLTWASAPIRPEHPTHETELSPTPGLPSTTSSLRAGDNGPTSPTVPATRSVTVNVNGPLSVRSDGDIQDLARHLADLVFGDDGNSAPASSQLAGARR